jgi:hypothetical protein
MTGADFFVRQPSDSGATSFPGRRPVLRKNFANFLLQTIDCK